jgi:hypothetical protein
MNSRRTLHFRSGRPSAGRALRQRATLTSLLLAILSCVTASAADKSGAAQFRKDVQPILTEYCYDCHADGMNKGEIAFDEFASDKTLLESRDLWWKVLKNLRAGIMPPEKKPRPTAEQKQQIEKWIKTDVFEIDPTNPDPGRVTVRRLNRVEYRNTIRDLMGVDFNTDVEFPPDDTGYGFDNVGDVLTLPPMLLEKYLDAAENIVSRAVPSVSRVMAERTMPGRSLRSDSANDYGPLVLSYYEPASISNTFQVEHSGHYKVVLNLSANEKFVDNQFDYNKCEVVFRMDGRELFRKEFTRQENKKFQYEYDQDWQTGAHELTFELRPLTPDEKQVRSLAIRVESIVLRGPADEKYWVKPKTYARFFPKDIPATTTGRHGYARELLEQFATKAFRRPVDAATVDRLTALAEETSNQPHQTFEAGVARAMVAVLASPRFLFREESTITARSGTTNSFPLIDEYALASRLSYFLWSSTPDDELFRLAREGKLRANQPAQVKRMLADSKSEALIRNFVGQWLQARDIDTVVIDPRAVLQREEKADPEAERLRNRFRELQRHQSDLNEAEKKELEEVRTKFFRSFRPPRVDFGGELRGAMRKESEKYFEYIVRNDRPLTELVDSDYTFLNERLARHYGVSGVSGDEMRKVTLPAGSPRGGILGQGTVLAVTSNPTRTSPVKRGLFVLDNILGMPPPPPPPNIPPLEDAAKDVKGHEPTLRETLEMHRAKPLCSSCHNRLDPLGLALDNFNAMGMWREKEHDQTIDVTGKLISGESFTNLIQLKKILVANHQRDFYRCLTEKLLTYALGRGLDYYDVGTVDNIVSQLERQDGHFSALLSGVVDSAPFQKRRNPATLAEATPSKPVQQRAEIKAHHHEE